MTEKKQDVYFKKFHIHHMLQMVKIFMRYTKIGIISI